MISGVSGSADSTREVEQTGVSEPAGQTGPSQDAYAQQALKVIFSVIDQQSARINGFEKLVKESQALTNGYQQEVKDIKSGTEKIKTQFIESLAVFVALFTFVSIDFQIFRVLNDIFSATGLVFITAGLLCGFLMLMDYLLVSDFTSDRKRRSVVIGLWIGCVVIGLLLLGFSFWNSANLDAGKLWQKTDGAEVRESAGNVKQEVSKSEAGDVRGSASTSPGVIKN